MMKSWNVGTSKQYSSHLNRWIEYCFSRKIDPFNASVSDGAEFLSHYFLNSHCDYSSMNTARSALSSILPVTDGKTFGKQPIIQRLLKGMFRERPSLPRYSVTYDVKPVFDFIKNINCSEETSLEMITKILATFMCILSGQRSQTLSSLSCKYMFIDENQCIFYIPHLLKTSRPGFHQAPLEFKAYKADESLCVVRMIRLYLKVTKSLRCTEHFSFFISYVTPHHPVTSKTIARWVTDILDQSGIDVVTFRPHSLRSASTAKAYKRGLSLTEIAKAAGWTNFKTFGSYYNKKVEDVNLGNILLSDC